MSGLREAKKRRTREAIQHMALDLYARQGYVATTVEQIAAAADISPATFFRYFRSKEATVLTDSYDALLGRVLSARPADEPPVEACRHALSEIFNQVSESDVNDALRRAELILTEPALRGAYAEWLRTIESELAAILAQRAGRELDDLATTITAAALVAALATTMRTWVATGRKDSFLPMLDSSLDLLANGLRL